MFFTLTKHVYAAKYEHAVIILNVTQNSYISLIDDAAAFLCMILAHEFTKDGSRYAPIDAGALAVDECNEWISFFLKEGYIMPGNTPAVLAGPSEPGGLRDYQWDHKVAWQPVAVRSWLDIARAVMTLRSVHRCIEQGALVELFDQIQGAIRANPIEPPTEAIRQLARIVDIAAFLYPKKSFCLAWASTFVLLAVRRGWKINVAIGAQATPFYAHAWAETSSGVVINDDQMVRSALAVLCVHPYGPV